MKSAKQSSRGPSGYQDAIKSDGSLPKISPEEQESYFSELLGYGVDRISKEPDLLRAEQEQLQRRIQETSVTNYKSFVTTSHCLKDLQRQLTEMSTSLDALSANLPKLQAAADTFRKDGNAINTRRDTIRHLYSNHAALLDILEVPSLMDTCIRSGNFDEALDLKAYANKLAVIHGDLPLVHRLLDEVAAASNVMLEQLLERLQGSVQLPECLRSIGYLRRLSLFSENDLRLQFLQRREMWIASMIADLQDKTPYEFLKRLTDVYRLHVFDVIMQYKAIFSSSNNNTNNPVDDGSILFSWVSRRIAIYIKTMEEQVPRLTEGGSLASVMDHAMYCGVSLGRVGADFRPLLAPLFERAALNLFQDGVDSSNSALATLLENHTWVALPTAAAAALHKAAAAAATPTLEETHDSAEITASHGGGEATEIGTTIPPASLIEYPPLAVYTNGMLSAFNELRHCAPLSLKSAVAESIGASLVEAARQLSQHGPPMHQHHDGDSEQQVYKAACSLFTTVLTPYVGGCMERIYPGGKSLIDGAAIARELRR